MKVCFISPLSFDRVPSPRTPVFFKVSHAVAICAVITSVATRPDNRSGDPGQTHLQLGEGGRGRALGEGVEIKATGFWCPAGGWGINTFRCQQGGIDAGRMAAGSVSGAVIEIGAARGAGGSVGQEFVRSAAGRFLGKEKARRFKLGGFRTGLKA